LSTEQATAMASLLAGASVSEAAADSGISRSTLYRWMRSDHLFRARMNRGRRELQDALDARLLAIAERAVEAVSQAIEGGDVRTAVSLLRGLGVLDGQRTRIGPEDADVLREEEELSAREEESSRRLRSVLAP